MSERDDRPARGASTDETVEPGATAGTDAASGTDPASGTTPTPAPADAAPAPETGGRDPRAGTMSMADYEAAMTDRNIHARNRGLPGLTIEGGTDPDPEAGRRQDRLYLRLLVAMVLLIVVGGIGFSLIVYLLSGGGSPT